MGVGRGTGSKGHEEGGGGGGGTGDGEGMERGEGKSEDKMDTGEHLETRKRSSKGGLITQEKTMNQKQEKREHERENAMDVDEVGLVDKDHGVLWLKAILQGTLCHLFQRLTLEGDKTNMDLAHQVSEHLILRTVTCTCAWVWVPDRFCIFPAK